MPCMAECRPIAWRRRRWLNPVLARERAECPGDLSGAVGQPGQDTLTSAVRWRVTGAEVAHPYGLDTGTEDRRASDRFQALRPKILWSRGVSRRHIVPRPAYYTTGGGARPAFRVPGSALGAKCSVDAVKAEAAGPQSANDLRQGQRVLRGVADVEDVHRAGRRQFQAASHDVRRLRAAPAERVDRPADLVRVAGRLHVGRHPRVVVAVRQAVVRAR